MRVFSAQDSEDVEVHACSIRGVLRVDQGSEFVSSNLSKFVIVIEDAPRTEVRMQGCTITWLRHPLKAYNTLEK